jgi:hypothetical protein
MPSEKDIRQEQEKAQSQLEANMATQMAAQQSLMEESARKDRLSTIRDTRSDRKRKEARERQQIGQGIVSEKRAQAGIRIGGVAAQRGGTQKLKSSAARRRKGTQEGWNKWGSKGKGLSLSLRGGASGRRPA